MKTNAKAIREMMTREKNQENFTQCKRTMRPQINQKSLKAKGSQRLEMSRVIWGQDETRRNLNGKGKNHSKNVIRQ